MKILHVTNGVEWSGGMEQIALLVQELKALGHENFLACPPGSRQIPRLAPLSIPIEPISMLQDYDLLAAWKVRRLIQKISPDVVHSHHAISHAVTLVALTGMPRPPLVVSRRVSFPPKRNPFSRWKYGSSRINAYSVVSRSVKDILARGGVAPEKIHVIYSALKPEQFSDPGPGDGIRKELGIPQSAQVVGKLANYSRWKGHHVFLEAAKIIYSHNNTVKFLLIGKDTENLGEEVRRLGLQGAVKILGFRADVPRLLSILDVSVNSAIEGEGLSGAMRESLMLGVPVVASDVSGNREIVKDGETGILVRADDAPALAKGILSALADPRTARERAASGRKWVLENATVKKMAGDTLKLYLSLL